MLKNPGPEKIRILSFKTVALDLILPRIPLILTAYLFYKFVKFQVLHGFGRLTNDSASYLFSALYYAKHAESYFPPDRELGYRAFILLISWLSPWETTQELVNYVTLIQIGLFLFLGLAWTIAVYRLIGPWPAVVVPLLFALDNFDSMWIAHIMSEAPAKLLYLSSLLLFLIGIFRNRPGLIFLAVFFAGLIPVFRSADIAMPFAAIFGVCIWWLFSGHRRWSNAITALALIALLIGPQLASNQFNYWKWGYYGSTTRGPHLFAARFVALADPEKARAYGIPDDVVDGIFRPFYNEWNSLAGLRGFEYKDSSRIFFPNGRYRAMLDRGKPKIADLIKKFLLSKGKPAGGYSTASYSMKLTWMAFRADPEPIVRSILLIVWDYIRLPFTENLWGEGLPRVRILPVFWFSLVGLFLLGRKEKSAAAIGVFGTGIMLLPISWTIVAINSIYNPRFAFHIFLLTLLLLFVANFLPSRKDSSSQAFNLD